MPTTLRRILALLAIYAIALQGVLAGPSSLAQAFADPTVICHSDPSGDNAPVPSGHTGCDHCILCNAIAATGAPAVVSLLAPLATRSEPLLPDEPALATARTFTPRLARAPPRAL